MNNCEKKTHLFRLNSLTIASIVRFVKCKNTIFTSQKSLRSISFRWAIECFALVRDTIALIIAPKIGKYFITFIGRKIESNL